jgi:hypothetical protein
VAGELLMGDIGNGRQQLLADHKLLFKAALLENGEVEEFVKRRALTGQGIGWIDAHLLASALVERAQLWTADTRLHAIAIGLGVSYQP